MLQSSPIQYQAGHQESAPDAHFGEFLSPRFYVALIRRRFLYLIIPFLIIAPLGTIIVMMLPAVYLAEGKILVESQRIPTELVRPTVTSLAAERIQVLEQRLTTRDNAMLLIEKFKLFSGRRSVLSNTDLVEMMRERTHIKPIELAQERSSRDRVSMAFTVGFEYEDPVLATKVAGELVTLILNEDLRNRTGRASETTRFLAREVNRLQAEVTTVETQLTELKQKRVEATKEAVDRRQALIEKTNAQIGELKAERLTKANRLSFNHPEVQAIQRKIAALERTLGEKAESASSAPEADAITESLENKFENLQKNFQEASTKLSAARLGEALERDQQAERFEVIEQPIEPQRPIRPNRLKLLALVLGAAFAAGAGLATASEVLDDTIRSRADLARLVPNNIIAMIPIVETRRDHVKRRVRIVSWLAVSLVFILSLAAAVYVLAPPLDVAWAQLSAKLLTYLQR